MSKISIAETLANIDITVVNDKPVFFSIKYVKADGSIKTIERAQKSVKHAHAGGDKSPTNNSNFNLKEKGVLLLHDTVQGGFKYAKITKILYYNGMEVIH